MSAAFTGVFRNEEPRLERLLSHVRPYFEQMVIGVQDSEDATLQIAQSIADIVVIDEPRGFGDATYPAVMGHVRSKWSFRCDGDEWPTSELLESLPELERRLEGENRNGSWIAFRSWIEGVEWEVPHRHLRFWLSRLGWPGTLHSRPDANYTLDWDTGCIEHRKSLDEHVEGYLGYLDVSGTNQGWRDHNRAMIQSAVISNAERLGWDNIRSRAWWPRVEGIIGVENLPAPQL